MKNKVVHVPKFEDVVNPFTRNRFLELVALRKQRGDKCVNCKSVKIILKQFSPDLGILYFCSSKCHKKFSHEHIYRASSVEKISSI